VRIFALLTYIGNKKCKENKTNTDPNPTTNFNPQSTKLQSEIRLTQ